MSNSYPHAFLYCANVLIFYSISIVFQHFALEGSSEVVGSFNVTKGVNIFCLNEPGTVLKKKSFAQCLLKLHVSKLMMVLLTDDVVSPSFQEYIH